MVRIQAGEIAWFVVDDLPDLQWMTQGACVGVDPAIFYAGENLSEDSPGFDLDQALAYCRRCPVRVDCLQYILSRPAAENYGVWGGTTPEDRRQLRGWRSRYKLPKHRVA